MAEAEKEITGAPAEETEHTNKSEFPVEKIGDESPAAATSEEVVTEKTDVIPAAFESAPVAEDSAPVAEMSAAVAEESVPGTEESAPVAAESVPGTDESAPVAEESVPAAEDTTSAAEENSDTPEQEDAEVQEAAEEKPTIKIETAPADFRFPTTNQTRHCFTRYIEYHRCIAAKGESASECDKFAKYYRSLCPSEWVERWNEQRENGTFPGPL